MPAQTISFFVITGTKTTSSDIQTEAAAGDPQPPYIAPVTPTTEDFTSYMTVNTATGSVLSCSFGPFELGSITTPTSQLNFGGGLAEYSQASVTPSMGTFVGVKEGTVSGIVTSPTQTPFEKTSERYEGTFRLAASVSIDISFSIGLAG